VGRIGDQLKKIKDPEVKNQKIEEREELKNYLRACGLSNYIKGLK